jgi:hypothetical protein
MPRKSLKNRKLPPWVTEAVKHWRWQQDRLHPLFPVTSPKYSGAWMDEVETQGHSELRRRAAEHFFIEDMLRIERNRIIDKLKKETPMTNQVRPSPTVDLQWLVDEMNKPEALAKYRAEIAAGQAAIAKWHAEKERKHGYTVFVDDNSHYQDESERGYIGEFATAEEAIAKCKEIVRESVESCREPGMTAEEIYKNYVSFGDDPFIMGVKFSAWDYAEQLAKHFAEEQERKWRERVYCKLMDIADEKGRQEIIDKLLKDAHRRD